MKEQLNELALFAGAGGGILGGKLLGWRTVCAVEWDGYARDVLVARQNDGCLEAFPIWDDVQTFDGNPWRGIVDVVSGGFPCQDISCAGKGAGIDGERSSMWKHMARIIGEIRPKYALVENSPMLVGRGLATVLTDLAEMGYDAEWGVVGAHNVAAPHKRDRIWILATDPNVCRCDDGSDSEQQHETDNAQIGTTEKDQQSGSLRKHRTSANGCDVSNATSGRCKEQREKPEEERNPSEQNMEIPNTQRERGQLSTERELTAIEQPWSDSETGSSGGIPREWWATEPNVGRVAHGVASRVDRLKAIGNGQVPQVAALAWRILTQSP